MCEIINKKPSIPHFTADLVDGVPATRAGRHGRWEYITETPWLQCRDEKAAAQAVVFLAERGVGAVRVGGRVLAPLMPASVITFAEDALMSELAHDSDAAAMIARLG